MLTIKIEAIDFDTLGCVLRVRGRNITENQYVKVCFPADFSTFLNFWAGPTSKVCLGVVYRLKISD